MRKHTYLCIFKYIYTQIYFGVDFDDEIYLFCVSMSTRPASPVYAVGRLYSTLSGVFNPN